MPERRKGAARSEGRCGDGQRAVEPTCRRSYTVAAGWRRVLRWLLVAGPPARVRRRAAAARVGRPTLCAPVRPPPHPPPAPAPPPPPWRRHAHVGRPRERPRSPRQRESGAPVGTQPPKGGACIARRQERGGGGGEGGGGGRRGAAPDREEGAPLLASSRFLARRRGGRSVVGRGGRRAPIRGWRAPVSGRRGRPDGEIITRRFRVPQK